MTADLAQLPWDLLQKISKRIVNEEDQINRIVYDITSKSPSRMPVRNLSKMVEKELDLWV